MGLPHGTVVKNPPASAADARDAGLTPGPGKIPWSTKQQPTPVFLLGKFHGTRSLVDGLQSVELQRVGRDRCAYWHWGEAGGADPILQMKRAKLKVKSQIKGIELGHKLRPFQSRVQILSTCSPVSLQFLPYTSHFH